MATVCTATTAKALENEMTRWHLGRKAADFQDGFTKRIRTYVAYSSQTGDWVQWDAEYSYLECAEDQKYYNLFPELKHWCECTIECFMEDCDHYRTPNSRCLKDYGYICNY